MKELTSKDLFYNLDDVINLFKNTDNSKFYKGRKIKMRYITWTKDINDKMKFYIK